MTRATNNPDVVGAMVGGFVFRLIGIAANGPVGSIVAGSAGAILLLLVVRFIKNL